MKAMEGIVVSYDGTVRNSNRHLVQLSYGEDGMDGAFMEFQQLPGIKPSNSSFKRRFYFDCSDQRCASYECVYLYIPVHVGWGCMDVWANHRRFLTHCSSSQGCGIRVSRVTCLSGLQGLCMYAYTFTISSL